MRILDNWMLDADEWKTNVDLNILKIYSKKFNFIERYDDFYITLIDELIETIESKEPIKDYLFKLSQNIELYSDVAVEKKFIGIDVNSNLLYAATGYYLAEKFASVKLVLEKIQNTFTNEIEKFLFSFLTKKLNLLRDNKYGSRIITFFEAGNMEEIELLKKELVKDKNMSLDASPELYISFLLTENIINKFDVYNVWSNILKYSKYDFDFWVDYVNNNFIKKKNWELFPSQIELLKNNFLNSDESMCVQMPTSSGKTAICELLIYKDLKEDEKSKILFLAPFRALATELKLGFARRIRKAGISIATLYGGNISTEEEKHNLETSRVIVATPEKFMAIENLIPDLYKQFSLIICDEGHLLDDLERGIGYELLLTKILSDSVIKKKFVFLSAIMNNIEKVNGWLGEGKGKIIKSEYRPTELEFGYLVKMEKHFNLELHKTYYKNKFLTIEEFITKNDFKYINSNGKEKTYSFSTYNVQSISTALKCLQQGVVAIFTPTKHGPSGVEGLVNKLIEMLNYGVNLPAPINFANREEIDNLEDFYKLIFGKDHILTKAVKIGVLIHHGDLPQNVREIIEEMLRNSKFRLLFCTSTLAEGVNMPIRTLVIHTLVQQVKATNGGRRYIRTNIDRKKLKNILGRTGRAGIEKKGTIIVTNPKDASIVNEVLQNIDFNDLESQLNIFVNELSDINFTDSVNINELRNKNVNFKIIYETIEMFIISNFDEKTIDENSDQYIKNLLSHTLLSKNTDDDKIRLLSILFKKIVDNIRTFKSKNNYEMLKKSGSNVELFLELTKLLESHLQETFFVEILKPDDENWIAFLIKILNEDPYITEILNDFNSSNVFSLNLKIIFDILKDWINGKWFIDIAEKQNTDVNTILKIFNSIIYYKLNIYISKLIRIIEIKLLEKQIMLSPEIKCWNKYINLGLNSQLKLQIVAMGFSDRNCIFAIEDYLLEFFKSKKSIGTENIGIEDIDIRVLIANQKNEILTYLKDKVCNISLRITENNLNHLEKKLGYNFEF